MKKIVICSMVVFFVFTSIIGCETKIKRSPEEEKQKYVQSSVSSLLDGLLYIKDPRTGLFFAYYWGGSGYGGPALATVPCESIPHDLLR